MKTLSLQCFALAGLLIAGSAHAGPGDSHRGRWEPDLDRRVERMSEELDLTEGQSAQLLEVFEASAAEREALREKMEEQFKPEMCAIHLATVEQVREILTDEQETELEGRLERWADVAEGKGRRGPRGGFTRECETES